MQTQTCTAPQKHMQAACKQHTHTHTLDAQAHALKRTEMTTLHNSPSDLNLQIPQCFSHLPAVL